MILSIISEGLYTKVIYISFLFIICLLILTSVLIAQETDSTVISSDINNPIELSVEFIIIDEIHSLDNKRGGIEEDDEDWFR